MRIGPILASRRFRLLAALLAAVGLYATLGFAVAPVIVRDQARSFVREHYARELGLGRVRVQPFLLQLELFDLSLPDADGRPMIGFRRLLVDLEASSIWHRALVFKEITLEAPELHAELRPGGALNLADLKLPEDPAKAREKSSPPALWIQSLSVQRGTVQVRDASRPTPLERTFDDVGFSLRDFRTTPQGGDFRFKATLQDDGTLEWSGRFALAPSLSSDGEVRVEGLRATGVAEILGDRLPFALTSGTIDIEAGYHVALAEPMVADVQVPRIELKSLGLRVRGEPTDAVRLPSLLVTGTRFSLAGRSLEVGAVVLDGLAVQVRRAADGSINLQRLQGKPSPDEPAGAGPPFAVRVGSVALQRASFDVEDRGTAVPAHLALAPVDASVREISLDLAHPLPVSLSVGLAKGKLEIAGKVTPQPLAADLDLTISALPLPAFQPYVAQVADLAVTAGELDVGAKVKLDPAGKPALQFAGDIAVDHLATMDGGLHESLVSLQRLQIDKLRFAQGPDSLDIDRVLLSRPAARVVMSPQGQLNLVGVMKPGRAEKEPSSSPMPIHVRQVRMEGGRIGFTDRSVEPVFAANLQDLTGTATGLSTSRTSRAKLDLHGRVDESPVSVQGELQPFGFDRFTDITLILQNVEMPIFTPYSGPVAGYSIAKGKLATDIHYRIEDRKLKAEHRIRIAQLEWGSATETKGQATLPVRFATSLLKDRNGVIDLDLPVAGTLDDPSFKVGPIVWQVFKNLIGKAVAAPFSLLGSLFAGAEAARFVDFAPGASTLDGGAAGSLGALAKSMKERPELTLEVPIRALADLDRAALAGQAMEAAVAAAQAGAPAGPGARAAALRAVVKKVSGSEARVPEGLHDAAELEFLERTARAAIKVPEADVDLLAQARAVAIEHALEAGGLEAGRIFKVREGKVAPSAGKVRLELGLK